MGQANSSDYSSVGVYSFGDDGSLDPTTNDQRNPSTSLLREVTGESI